MKPGSWFVRRFCLLFWSAIGSYVLLYTLGTYVAGAPADDVSPFMYAAVSLSPFVLVAMLLFYITVELRWRSGRWLISAGMVFCIGQLSIFVWQGTSRFTWMEAGVIFVIALYAMALVTLWQRPTREWLRTGIDVDQFR